jgi:ribosomal-protein-alanine N-acetyltransferase
MPLQAPSLIESERLLLRLVQEDDLPALFNVNGSDEVTRFLPYATWKSQADGQAWFMRMSGFHSEGTALQFVIINKASNTAIGTCLLFRYDEASARAELGYVMGRTHWGAGFMYEALTALITHAFKVLCLRRLEAEIDPRNVPSERLLLRLSFTREGLLRQRWVGKGEIKDAVIYGLLRHEWPASSK